jgi:hypothetical protein
MRRIYLKYFDSAHHSSGDNFYRYSHIICPSIFIGMKTLPFQRDTAKNRVTVACATGSVSVYSSCAYCRHCQGVRVGDRFLPPPQVQALRNLRQHDAADETLMNAGLMFNALVRDGSAIECDDDTSQGFQKLY